MALPQKVYGVKTLFLERISAVRGVFNHQPKAEKALRPN